MGITSGGSARKTRRSNSGTGTARMRRSTLCTRSSPWVSRAVSKTLREAMLKAAAGQRFSSSRRFRPAGAKSGARSGILLLLIVGCLFRLTSSASKTMGRAKSVSMAAPSAKRARTAQRRRTATRPVPCRRPARRRCRLLFSALRRRLLCRPYMINPETEPRNLISPTRAASPAIRPTGTSAGRERTRCKLPGIPSK